MSGTVRKIGPILDLFTSDHPEWSAVEVAETVGIPRSSAHTLLNSLAQIGLLRSIGRGRFRLGWRPLELDAVLRATSLILPAAARAMDDLARRTGETVQLAAPRNGRILQIDVVLGRRAVTVDPSPVGAAHPMHSSAIGKMLASQIGTATLRSCLRAQPPLAFTRATITSPDLLLPQMREIFERGFALEVEETEAGVCGVAAPVSDDEGTVIAALGLLVPSDRFEGHRHELVRAVIHAADAVSIAVANPPTGR